MSCFVLFPSTSKKLQEIYCLYENTKKKLGSLATNPPLFFLFSTVLRKMLNSGIPVTSAIKKA